MHDYSRSPLQEQLGTPLSETPQVVDSMLQNVVHTLRINFCTPDHKRGPPQLSYAGTALSARPRRHRPPPPHP